MAFLLWRHLEGRRSTAAELIGGCVDEFVRSDRSYVHMGVIAVDVSAVPPDARSIEALARLQLRAIRRGRRVRLRNAAPELLELVSFMGLRDVLPAESPRANGPS